MAYTKYEEYVSYRLYAVRELLKDEKVGVRLFFELLAEEMTFANVRHGGGQLVLTGSEAQRRHLEEESGYSWGTIKVYISVLIKKGLIRRVGRDCLQINPNFAYKGRGDYAPIICRMWNETMVGT